MSKRYAEPIEVMAPEGAPEAFSWRGRRYRVRRVIARWREAGDWWRDEANKPWAAGRAREVVRVDAGAGIYEIARDLRTGSWSLVRVWD